MKIPDFIISDAEYWARRTSDPIMNNWEGIEYNREQALKYIKAYKQLKKEKAEDDARNRQYQEFVDWAKKYNTSYEEDIAIAKALEKGTGKV